jgi:transcriptional regulator with XRE-family HTH domain
MTMPDSDSKTGSAPHKLDKALGLRIRETRQALRVSLPELADAIGLTAPQIQKYERGSNRVSFSRLVDIAHALDRRVVDLIADLDDASVPNPTFRRDVPRLGPPGAAELLAAYLMLPISIRKALVNLMIEMGKHGHAATMDWVAITATTEAADGVTIIKLAPSVRWPAASETAP